MPNGADLGLMAKIGAGVVALVMLPFAWLWSAVGGARRSAQRAERDATRALTRVDGLKDSMKEMREAQSEGFESIRVQMREVHVSLTMRIDNVLNGRNREGPPAS